MGKPGISAFRCWKVYFTLYLGFSFQTLLATMLTEFEIKMILQIYRICCKSATIPFSWQDEQLLKSPNPSNRQSWYRFIWLLTLLTVSFRVSRVPSALIRGDANAAILNGTSALEGFYYIIAKVNIWIYRDELQELIWQVRKLNSVWGESVIYCLLIINSENIIQFLFSRNEIFEHGICYLTESRENLYIYHDICYRLHIPIRATVINNSV